MTLGDVEEGGAPLSPTSANARSSFGWIKFINLTAVTILSVLVGIMFVQLQYVTYELSQQSQQLSALTEQVQNTQADQIQDLSKQVQQNESLTLIQMAGTFVLLTSLLTMFHMSSHLRNYHEPVIQRKIIAILWMSPIYAVTSFFSVVVPAAEGYLAVLKDFYEAYVIYTFLSFLISVLGRGDRNVAVQVLSKHADHLSHPTRCFRTCYHPPPEESDTAKANAVLMECQLLALQFVLCRPLTSIASFVISTLNENEPTNDDDTTSAQVQKFFTSPQFYISMIQNISVFLAFAGLLKLYHAIQDDVAWMQPFSKFLCIKGVVFLTFWQGLIIDISVSLTEGGRWEEEGTDQDPRDKALRIQNVLICLEMLFFSIAHWCVFPHDEWKDGYRPPESMPKPGIGFSDLVQDVGLIMQSSQEAIRQRRIREGNYLPAPYLERDEIEQPPSEVRSVDAPQLT